jgi:hypothetical protein
MRIPVFVSCPTALDKRQDPSRDRIIQELSRLQLSPWNHFEAGILFGLQIPLLIFREEPIRGGVFDDGVTDVFIHSMPPGDLAKDNLEAFREVLLKWSARVRERYYRTG